MKFEFNYDIKTVQYEKERKLIEKTDILIVSVNEAEREGILKYLLPVPSKRAIIEFIHNKINYRIGRVGCHLIAHVESGMGSVEQNASLATVLNAIDTVKPKLVIMVGVAFGISKKKQKIGDVLVSKRVINYEVSRINSGNQSISPRGSTPNSGKLLYNVFSSIIDWSHYLNKTQRAEILTGDVLSGEKLIDNLEFCEKLKSLFPKAVGGEMEGTGLSSACMNKDISEWIIIKGICDWADGKKNKKAQPIAADSAMSLLFHVLSNQNIFYEQNIFTYSKRTVNSENNRYIMNARRGSPLWTLNRLRSSLIPMLVKDLKAYKENGYADDICDAVRKDLNGLSNEISKLPKSYNGGNELNRIFSEFIDFYLSWNDVKGSSEISKMNRIKNRDEIKKKRDELAKVIRISQKTLCSNLEEINTLDMFKYQEELLNKYSDVFPNFKRAVNRVKKILKTNDN